MYDWRTTNHIGYCFGTVLMRASFCGFYPSSVESLLKKIKFYLVTLGDEEEEESFWLCGRELMTLYSNSYGFRQVFYSDLEKQIMESISEHDFTELYEHYGSAHGDNEFRSLEDNYHNIAKDPNIFRFIRDPIVNQSYCSLKELVNVIEPLGETISVYRIHIKEKPYYLEEIIHAKANKNI